MQTKTISIAFILTVFTLILAQGCNTARQTTLTQKDLNGTWVLKSINSQDATTLFNRTLPTLEFNFKEKIIAGTGGCNRYTGRFLMINNLLKTPDIVSTRMACLDMDPSAESKYYKALQEDKTLSLKDDILQMTDGKKNIVLEFRREKAIMLETAAK